jgi:AAA domain
MDATACSCYPTQQQMTTTVLNQQNLKFELPKQPKPPETTDPRVLILYGSPKVGKTTILSQLPGCLIIDLEDGTDYLTALKVKAHNMDELEAIAQALRNPPNQYPYIAIDTVSAMEDWAEIRGTQRYKLNPTGKNFKGDSVLELPHGHGYLWLRLAFQELLGMFSGTTRRLILVCHLRDKFLDKGGQEVAVKDLELTGKIRNITAAKADTIGYLYRNLATNQGRLMVSFQTFEHVSCGSRCEHLKGQNFEFDWKKVYKELK